MPEQTSTIPGSAYWMEEWARRKMAWEQARARLTQQQQSVWNQFGFQGSYTQGADGTFQLSNFGVDPNNRTGLYQQTRQQSVGELEQLAQRQALGTRGGLARQQERKLRGAQGSRDADLMRGLLGTMGEWSGSWMENEQSWNQSKADIMKAATEEAIANQQFNLPPAPGATPKPPQPVKWGGKTWKKGQWTVFAEFLRQRGANPTVWARKHPQAAQYLKGGS